MRKLRLAFSKKEKGEELLARLEELNEAGELEESQYQQKLEQYQQMIDQSNEEISSIRASLTGKLEALQRDLERYPAELKDLELKSKLGEIDADAYAGRAQKLQSRIARLEQDVEETKTFLEAETAEQAGGTIEIRLDRKPLLRRPKWLKLP